MDSFDTEILVIEDDLITNQWNTIEDENPLHKKGDPP